MILPAAGTISVFLNARCCSRRDLQLAEWELDVQIHAIRRASYKARELIWYRVKH